MLKFGKICGIGMANDRWDPRMRASDAEGRLVLADALAFGITPTLPASVIDFATLTER